MNEFKSLADDSRWISAMNDRVKSMERIEQLEKENVGLNWELETVHKTMVNVLEENGNLKQQLSEIKYLNRQEVEKILWDVIHYDEVTELYIFDEDPEDNFITAICKLALSETWEISACLYKTPEIEGIKNPHLHIRTSPFSDEQNVLLPMIDRDKLMKILADNTKNLDGIFDGEFVLIKNVITPDRYTKIVDEIISAIGGSND